MTLSSIQNRYQAFAVHLAFSIVLLAALLLIIFLVWFPYDFIKVGGLHGLKILAGVDLVLGPLLTLIVFNRSKKSLKFDLSVIAIIQLSCMAAGMWLIYNQRPLIQTLADDGMHIMTATDFKTYEVDYKDVEIPGATPKNIFIDMNAEQEGQAELERFVGAFMSGKPISLRTEKYLYSQEVGEEAYQKRLELISKRLSDTEKNKLASYKNKDGCTWIPVHSNHFGGYGCVLKDKGIIQLKSL